MTKTFIDRNQEDVAELEQRFANDLGSILDRPVKYEAEHIHPSDPQSDSEMCKIVLELEFTPKRDHK